VPFKAAVGGALLQTEGVAYGKMKTIQVTKAISDRSRYIGESSWVDGFVMVTFLDEKTNQKFMQYQPK